MQNNKLFAKNNCNSIYNNKFKSLSFRKKHNTMIFRNHKSNIYGGILSTINKNGSKKYVVVQGRYTGKWSFPKGHINENEQPMRCSLREIEEETGLTEKILKKPYGFIRFGYGNYYLFRLEEESPLIPQDTKEIMDTKWATLEDLEKMQLNADASYYRKYLLDGICE